MSFYKKERVYKMKRKTFKHNKIFIVLGLMLFMFVLIGGFSSFKVKGLDPIDETPPIEEEVIPEEVIPEEVIPEEVIPEEVIPEDEPIIVEEEKGFFETLIIGLFNFLSSAEFTAFVTSASIVIVTIYSILRPFLKIKQQVKYDKLMQDLKNKDEKLDKYEQLLTGYAQIADSSLKQSNAIKESLQLGFDKSNLKQDVKDKILNTLSSVEKINIPSIKETIINDLVEPLKEEINDSNIEPKITIPKGW
jgi:hypothetical protein